MPIAAASETDRLYSTKELAERWHLSESTINRLRIRGRLRAIRVGRVWRFRTVDTDAYLAELAELEDGG